MAAHSSVLAWGIPWTEEPGRILSMGSQRVRHDLVTKQQQTKAFYAGKLCDHTYFSEKALWQPHCEGCIAEGQDWGMGSEGEGIKSDTKVLSLARTPGMVILSIKPGNT